MEILLVTLVIFFAVKTLVFLFSGIRDNNILLESLNYFNKAQIKNANHGHLSKFMKNSNKVNILAYSVLVAEVIYLIATSSL